MCARTRAAHTHASRTRAGCGIEYSACLGGRSAHALHAPCLSLPRRVSQVNGKRYALFECVYLRPWPNAEPWIARIEEMNSIIGRKNKPETWIRVRWFYQRHQLLP